VYLDAKRRYVNTLPFLLLSKMPLHMGIRDVDLHVMHGFLGPPESSTQTVSRSVEAFYRALGCDRLTDRPRFSVIGHNMYVVLRCDVIIIMAALRTRCRHYIFAL